MTRIRNTSRGNVAHITGSFLSPRFGRKRHNDCTNKTPLYSRADAHVAKLKEPIARLPGGIATVIAGATASKYISGNCFINSKSRAMKSKLTPFDGELLVMIADIMKVEPTVEESATTYTISVPIGDNTPDTVTAMQNAVRGRLGKRLIMFEDVDNCKRYSVAYVDDAESMADKIRTEYDAPDATAGTRYCRTLKEVDAIQVDRDNLEALKRFTGGGTMTIPRTPGAIAKYSFPSENGVMIDAPETWVIVRESNGRFSVMSKKEFDRDFEPKGTAPTCGNCSNMRHEDFAGVGYCNTVKDNTTCDQKACGHYEPKN